MHNPGKPPWNAEFSCGHLDYSNNTRNARLLSKKWEDWKNYKDFFLILKFNIWIDLDSKEKETKLFHRSSRATLKNRESVLPTLNETLPAYNFPLCNWLWFLCMSFNQTCKLQVVKLSMLSAFFCFFKFLAFIGSQLCTLKATSCMHSHLLIFPFFLRLKGFTAWGHIRHTSHL